MPQLKNRRTKIVDFLKVDNKMFQLKNKRTKIVDFKK